MAADIAARGKDVPDSAPSVQTTHACCSTCCDDTASIGSDEAEDSATVVASPSQCTCNSKGKCSLHRKLEEEFPCKQSTSQYYQPINVYEMHPQFQYHFTEEEIRKMSSKGNYVEFYKGVSNLTNPVVSRLLNDRQKAPISIGQGIETREPPILKARSAKILRLVFGTV